MPRNAQSAAAVAARGSQEGTMGSDPAIREALVTAAIELLQERGAAAMTTRELAARAGVANGTPFNYFRTKDEIVAAVLEHILSRTSFPEPDPANWQASLKTLQLRLWDAFEPYEGIATLVLTRDASNTSPTAQRFYDYAKALLQEAGQDPERAGWLSYWLFCYVLGALLSRNYEAEHGVELPSSFRRERFAMGLDAMLAGLDALPAPSRGRRRR
jgi:AcrR family transcriptional regulator